MGRATSCTHITSKNMDKIFKGFLISFLLLNVTVVIPGSLKFTECTIESTTEEPTTTAVATTSISITTTTTTQKPTTTTTMVTTTPVPVTTPNPTTTSTTKTTTVQETTTSTQKPTTKTTISTQIITTNTPGTTQSTTTKALQSTTVITRVTQYTTTAQISTLKPSLVTTDQGFGPWSPWSDCSQTCNGSTTRSRTCHGYCNSHSEDRKRCNQIVCPIHGGLSLWSDWSLCNSTCGGGNQSRYRRCNEPTPAFNGLGCFGLYEDVMECNMQNCPVQAILGPWSAWSACDKPCNTGHNRRTRICSKALYGGNGTCDGTLEESIVCNVQICKSMSVIFTIRLDETYSEELKNKFSKDFKQLEEKIITEVMSTYVGYFSDSIKDVILLNAVSGSVVVTLQVIFLQSDSYQFLYIQDSIEVEKSIGKLSVLPGELRYNMSTGIPLSSPDNVSIANITSTKITLTWDDVPVIDYQAVINGYIVFYREKLSTFSKYNLIATNNYSCEVIGLTPWTNYVFRVLAYTSAGNGIASKQIIAKTLEAVPGTAPTYLQAKSVSPFMVLVEWERVNMNDFNGRPLGYHVIVEHLSTYTSFRTGSEKESYFVGDLFPSTNYIFTVCAFNRIGSGPCDHISVRTSDSPPTEAPRNLTVDSIKTHNSLTIHWIAPSANKIHSDITSYKLFYQPVKTGIKIIKEGNVSVTTTHPLLTDVTLKYLEPNTEYSIQVIAVNQYGDGVAASIKAKTCNCPEQISTNYHIMQPYAMKDSSGNTYGLFPDLIDEIILYACGQCNRPSGKSNTTIDKIYNGRNTLAGDGNLESVLKNIDEYTDVTFPVIGQIYLTEYMEYPYVPLFDHPGSVFIVKDNSINDVISDIINAIFAVLPLLIINFMMMIVVALIIWLLEAYTTRKNDFSKKPFEGLQEAWYWSYITQGTQGYGDFVPRRKSSRIFAIAWMIIAIIMQSLLTGAIVTAITSVNEIDVKIYGTEIGAMYGSLEEIVGILRNGKINTKENYTTAKQLATALEDGRLFGVLVDAYTAGSNKYEFSRPHMRVEEMIKYPRTYGFVLSGQLRNIAGEFQDFIKVNEGYIQNLIERSTEKMMPMDKKPLKSPFDPESTYFINVILAMVMALLLSFFCGVIFWFWMQFRSSLKVDIVYTEKEQYIHDSMKLIKNFRESFLLKTRELSEKQNTQRVKLHFDQGESSLRNQTSIGKSSVKNKRKATLSKRMERYSVFRKETQDLPLKTFDVYSDQNHSYHPESLNNTDLVLQLDPDENQFTSLHDHPDPHEDQDRNVIFQRAFDSTLNYLEHPHLHKINRHEYIELPEEMQHPCSPLPVRKDYDNELHDEDEC